MFFFTIINEYMFNFKSFIYEKIEMSNFKWCYMSVY